MKTILAFAIMLVLGAPAIGAEAAFTVLQVINIHAAAQQMSCQQRIIKDGAKETAVCEPYSADKMKPSLAWQIAEVQSTAAGVVNQYQRARNILLASAARKPDGNLTDEAQARFLVSESELLDKAANVTLPRFKRAELEPLNLTPSILSALLPIVE